MNNKITCKKIKTFPSLEWGPHGGFCADIYFEGVKQGYFHQDGEGGNYVFQPDSYSNPAIKNEKELNQYCKEYFKNNQFARLYSALSLEAIEQFANLETMVCHWMAMNNVKKTIKKMQKKSPLYTKYIIVLKEPSEIFDSHNVIAFYGSSKATETSIVMHALKFAQQHGWKSDEKLFIYTFEKEEDLLKLI